MFKEFDELLKSIPNTENLNNKTVVITGSTGLIGSRLVEFLLELNSRKNTNINIIASGRSTQRLEARFSDVSSENLMYWELDLESERLEFPFENNPNFVIHAASAANPKYYRENPVETMTGNFSGCLKLLNLFSGDQLENFLFVSSGEVYGNFDTSISKIDETMSGEINGLDSRSCYPISKRAAETLCVSYSVQHNQKVTIARPSHIFGPGFNRYDTRISADFFRLALEKKDLVMKSKGEQLRSYTYVDDCVTGLLCILLNGKNKEAYNVTKTDNEIYLRDFAQKIADRGHTQLIFDIDETQVQKTMAYASFDNKKLKELGWQPFYSVDKGVNEVFNIME